MGKKLEEIPIPFHDLKNVVEELRFEDDSTRARCRGWLVLQSKKFLQVNIIFPGSDVDCRISLRALTGESTKGLISLVVCVCYITYALLSEWVFQ